MKLGKWGLFLGGVLSAVICIEDPVRDVAKEVVQKLRKLGFKKIVMMTGDNEKTAEAMAHRVGVDSYYAEVLPEDNASTLGISLKSMTPLLN